MNTWWPIRWNNWKLEYGVDRASSRLFSLEEIHYKTCGKATIHYLSFLLKNEAFMYEIAIFARNVFFEDKSVKIENSFFWYIKRKHKGCANGVSYKVTSLDTLIKLINIVQLRLHTKLLVKGLACLVYLTHLLSF